MPVCPLCNCPVSLGTAGALPDEVVGRHIDNDCQSETAQSRRKVCMHLTHFSLLFNPSGAGLPGLSWKRCC